MREIYIISIVVLALFIAFILLFIVIYERKTRFFILQQKEFEFNKQREIFEAISNGEEAERKRIAQDLHDGVGAKLSGVKMHFEHLLKQQSMPNPLFNSLIGDLAETVEEIREISHNLEPTVVKRNGINKALQDFIVHLNSKGVCKFECFIDLGNYHPAINVQVSIYRIVIEMLHNVIKHAKAQIASLQIAIIGNELQIICEDDGVGFDINATVNGIGLLNINNRINYLKGNINIDSTSNGTTIIVHIPINHG